MTMDNDKLVEEMVLAAEAAKSPKGVGEVVDRGEGDRPPMVVSSVSGNDKVYVYDTVTGQRSTILRYMLSATLQKKHKDGSRAFTTADPKIEQKVGKMKCLLHPDNEKRAHYDELGLPLCNKSNLVSAYHVNRHMQKKHKDEWSVISAEATAKEKEEDRKFQRGLLEKVAG